MSNSKCWTELPAKKCWPKNTPVEIGLIIEHNPLTWHSCVVNWAIALTLLIKTFSSLCTDYTLTKTKCIKITFVNALQNNQKRFKSGPRCVHMIQSIRIMGKRLNHDSYIFFILDIKGISVQFPKGLVKLSLKILIWNLYFYHL